MFRFRRTYKKALHRLIHVLPKTIPLNLKDEASLEHSRKILAALGSPQNSHPVVHVAGTSGKGTICYLIDGLLRAHTKHSAMMVSPHVYDIRERIQIDGSLISERDFARTFYEVNERAGHLHLNYFVTQIVMGFLATSRKKLDYLIVETGMGGLYDTTNTVTRKPKTCILGQIGLDHTAVLGNTLEKIAIQKAGIVQEGSLVIALRQDPAVNKVFEERCREKHAQLIWVETSDDYQTTNDNLALTAARELAKRDVWDFDEKVAKSTLREAFIPGRFEKRDFKDHLIILDGAHNPQKLSALVHRLQSENIEACTFIVAIGDRKDFKEMLTTLKPVAKRIIATEFFTEQQDIPKRPISSHQLVQIARELGIESETQVKPADALSAALSHPEPIVATGSFYLLSEIDRAM